MVGLRYVANYPLEGRTQRILCTAALLYQGWGWFDRVGMGCINCDSAHIVGIILGYCRPFVFGNGD